MLARKLFICSAIEKCQEKAQCCPHKNPHIKDERCVPRECRYAPGVESIDCDEYDPEHPRVPVPQPVETRMVEEVMKEKETATQAHITQSAARLKEKQQEDAAKVTGIKNGDTLTATVSGTIESDGSVKLNSVAITKDAAKEQDIKEAVKKQAAKDHPVNYAKGPKTKVAEDAGKAKVSKKGGKKVS